MADFTINAADVVPVTTDDDNPAVFEDLIAAEAIDAGESVYKDTNGEAALTDADAAASAVARGMAVNSAADGQPVRIMRSGLVDVTSNASAQGKVALLSTTAGKLCPTADLASGDYVNIAAVFVSNTRLKLMFQNTGIALP